MSTTPLTSLPVQDLTTPSLRRRMACWLYEGMLLFGVMVSSGLIYFVTAYWMTGLAPGDMKIHQNLKSGLQASSFLVLGLYFIWMWRRGQTLAMKTWRIQIVDAVGQKINRQTAFKRYLASWLWFIPPLAMSSVMGLSAIGIGFLTLAWVVVWGLLSKFQAQGQFWHDAWSGTRLITTTT